MTDLITAIVLMTLLSIAAGWLSSRIAYSAQGQWNVALLAISIVAAIFFQFYASGQLFWARLVSSSAAIIYTNLAAIFAALAAGWVMRIPNTPRWRKIGLAIMLSLMSIAAILWPLLSIAVRPPPPGGDNWQADVAMQTSWATCSPAAAATLLRAEGIRTSEREMIPLCLTDSAGTPTLGLYRGIKLMADQNQRSVEVLNRSISELDAADDWPVLLAVRLPFGVEDRRYADQWGWIPGMGHSVVVLERTGEGGFLIADPAVGPETWTRDDLDLLWHGAGLRIH